MTTVQRFTLMATGLGLFMIYLDALIVNVALPVIQADFQVGESGLQSGLGRLGQGLGRQDNHPVRRILGQRCVEHRSEDGILWRRRTAVGSIANRETSCPGKRQWRRGHCTAPSCSH